MRKGGIIRKGQTRRKKTGSRCPRKQCRREKKCDSKRSRRHVRGPVSYKRVWAEVGWHLSCRRRSDM